MHPLREAMLDQMLLRGHSLRTQQSYLNAVSFLANRVRVKQLKIIRQRLAIQPGCESCTKPDSDYATRVNQPCPKCQSGVLHFVGEILSARQRRRYALSVTP